MEIAPVRVQDLHLTLASTGTVDVEEKVELLSEIGGVVSAVYHREGDFVKKGAPLLKLDDRSLQLDLKKALAELRREEKNFQILKKEYERKLISLHDFEEAKHRLVLKKLQKEQIELTLQKTLLRSPFPALITGCYVTPGQRILPNTKVFSLINPETMVVVTYFPEVDLKKIQRGQRAKVFSESRVLPYRAEVMRISEVVDSKSGMVKVVLRVLPPRKGLLVGSMVRVEILVGEKKQAVLVPKQAVLRRKGKTVVFVVQGERAEKREVELGVEWREWVEVKKGVEGGEWVAVEGHYHLEGGEKVKIFRIHSE